MSCCFIGRKINQFLVSNKVDYTKDIMEVETVPGSFWGIRSTILKEVGFLDENVFLFYEENILGVKLMKLGYKEGILTKYSYLHNHSVSIKKNLNIIKGHQIYLESMYYFENTYRKLNKIQNLFLKIMMRYSLWEMTVLVYVREVIRRCIK